MLIVILALPLVASSTQVVDSNSTFHPDCHHFLNTISDRTSDFYKCAMDHSKPFLVCSMCWRPYKEVQTLVSQLERSNKSAGCASYLLSSDRVMIIQRTMRAMDAIWNSAFCEDCYKSIDQISGKWTAVLANKTVEFFRKSNHTWQCFNKFVNHSNILRPLNITPCVACNDTYRALLRFYITEVYRNDQTICMDIRDSLNFTQQIWGSFFDCRIERGSLAPVWVLTAFFCFLPVLFYSATRFHGGLRGAAGSVPVNRDESIANSSQSSQADAKTDLHAADAATDSQTAVT